MKSFTYFQHDRSRRPSVHWAVFSLTVQYHDEQPVYLKIYSAPWLENRLLSLIVTFMAQSMRAQYHTSAKVNLTLAVECCARKVRNKCMK